MNQVDRRSKGMLYDPLKTGDPAYMKARVLLLQVNAQPTCETARPFLEQMLGSYPASAAIVPPFYCDLGPQIFLEEGAFLNMDCLILDEGKVQIGKRTMIGPRCSMYTATHPLDARIRQTGVEQALPITIEEDVWIGGSCVINGGVTIHKESVIGSGSVVTRDIPAGVLAAGNPCRIIRKLDTEEKARWQALYKEYEAFLETESAGSLKARKV